MAKENCLPPVIIDGVTITPDLIEELKAIKDNNSDGSSSALFTEQCLIISTIDLDKYGIDREFFNMLLSYHKIMVALRNR